MTHSLRLGVPLLAALTSLLAVPEQAKADTGWVRPFNTQVVYEGPLGTLFDYNVFFVIPKGHKFQVFADGPLTNLAMLRASTVITTTSGNWTYVRVISGAKARAIGGYMLPGQISIWASRLSVYYYH